MSQFGGQGANPGEGARVQAARAAAEFREAERKLAAAQRRQAAWAAGAEGEQRTASVLSELQADGWQLLHDVHWPGRPFANIDHIAVGPAGVLVIDSKNWSGRVDVRHGVLRQNGYRRTEACEGVAAAAAAVAALLAPRHRMLVSAIICLVGQPTPGEQPSSVEVTGLSDLASSVRARPSRVSSSEVSAITAHLRRTLAGGRSPAQTTTAALAHVGPAPSEPSLGYAVRRHRAASVTGYPGPSRTPSPGAGTRGPTRPSRRRGSRVAAVLKLVAMLYLLLVLLPAVVNGMAQRGGSTPTRPVPAPTTGVPFAPSVGTPAR
jgi:hypothetical protein